jgi:hypothetical protein
MDLDELNELLARRQSIDAILVDPKEFLFHSA